jgi:hypothetical protein
MTIGSRQFVRVIVPVKGRFRYTVSLAALRVPLAAPT